MSQKLILAVILTRQLHLKTVILKVSPSAVGQNPVAILQAVGNKVDNNKIILVNGRIHPEVNIGIMAEDRGGIWNISGTQIDATTGILWGSNSYRQTDITVENAIFNGTIYMAAWANRLYRGAQYK